MYNQPYMGYPPMMFGPPHPMMRPPPPVMSPRPQPTDLAVRRNFQWPANPNNRFKDVREFEVSRPLGKGGFSEVFKARCRKTGQTYALKKIDLLKINFDDYAIIKGEIEIHAGIKGVNIVEFVDWFKESDTIYIVLEYVDGMTLFEYLNKHHPLSESFIKKTIRQILEGLEIIHKAGVIHKDLKPENVMLDQGLNAKICDFGWSERIKEVNISGTIVYMAPEILKLESYNDKVDIWTVGILLYELFHNIEPFKGETPQDVLQAIMTQSLKFDKNCPKEARDLIKYILNIDKNYRPKISQILNHPYLKGEVKTPSAHGTAQPAQPQNAIAGHVLRLASERQGDVQMHGGGMRPNSDHLNNHPLRLGHQGQPSNEQNRIFQAQPHQTGINMGQRHSVSENKVHEGLMLGQTQSSKHIPAYDLFENSQRPKDPLRSTGYTVQVNPTPSGQTQASQGTRTNGSIQIASLRAENERKPQSYAPLNVAHAFSAKTLHRTGMGTTGVRQVPSTQSNPSPENRSSGQPSPHSGNLNSQNTVSPHAITPTHQGQAQPALVKTKSEQQKPLTLHHTQAPGHAQVSYQNAGYLAGQGAPRQAQAYHATGLNTGNMPFSTYGQKTYTLDQGTPKAVSSVGLALLTATQQHPTQARQQPPTIQTQNPTTRH